MERITIIGLSPIGVSIGLALKRAGLDETEVVGTSPDRQTLSVVSKVGAFDKTTNNLPSALEGADLVVLDAALTDTRELMGVLGESLKEGAVVTDTGNAKVRIMEWAQELLPKGVSFVAGSPLLKKPMNSVDDASATAFKGISYCVMPSSGADDSALKSVIRLVEAIGASPLFLDPHEYDSYAVAMKQVPILLSAAMVNATAGSESWREMHRLAASEFDSISRLASSEPQDSEAACSANAEAVVHWLDQIIAELYRYRNQINDSSEELLDSLIKAWEARARWEAGVVGEDSGPELPKMRDTMAAAFLGERAVQRYRQFTEGNKNKKPWEYFKKDRSNG